MRLVLSVLFISTFGCAGTWRELRTEHFRVMTNASESEAIETAAKLERLHLAMRQVLKDPTGPPVVLDAIFFATQHELANATRPGFSGFFSTRGTLLADRPAIVFTANSLEERTDGRKTLVHELAHFFTAWRHPWLPTWLNEGLSVYFEGLVFSDDDRQLIEGIVGEDHLTSARDGDSSLEQLWQWRGLASGTPKQKAHLYGLAGLWTHFLKTERGPQLDRYLSTPTVGPASRTRFEETFGNSAERELAFKSYLERDTWGVLLWTAPPVPSTSPPVPMTEEAIALMRGALSVAWNHPDQTRAAIARLHALPKVPAEAAVLEVLADRAERRRTTDEDLARLKLAVDARSDREMAWLALAEVAVDRDVPNEELLALLDKALAANPGSPTLEARRAEALVRVHRVSEGLAAAERAVQKAPWSNLTQVSLTLALAASDRCSDARNAAARALLTLGDQANSDAAAKQRAVLDGWIAQCERRGTPPAN